MTLITCKLTAKNRDQLWNPTRVSAAFTSFAVILGSLLMHKNEYQLSQMDQRDELPHLHCDVYIEVARMAKLVGPTLTVAGIAKLCRT